MTISSESCLNDVHTRALSALCSRSASNADHTWVSFRHYLKAIRVVDGVSRRLRDLGFTEVELRAVYPVMLHVEALVYHGDLTYEENQKQRSSSSNTLWSSGIEEILDSYGLDDHELRKELEELNRYFHNESLIMLRDSQVTESMIVETCHRRSSDIRLLVRLAYQLTRRAGCEEHIRSSRPFMAIVEIFDDFASYERDTAEDSFNTLRAFGWACGTDQAREKIEALMRALIHDCIDEMAHLKKPALIAKCKIITHWQTLLRKSCKVEIKPNRLFLPLSNFPLRPPQKFFFHLAARQLKFIIDDLHKIIPQMIEEPSQLA